MTPAVDRTRVLRLLRALTRRGAPSDNGHAMRLLGEHGVVPAALAGRMAQAVGFRNVLVHDGR